jgi:hypothetical protein
MFGFGNRNRNRVQNDTFGSNKLRNAAIAGVGMLAWQWWRNRQSSQSNTGWSGGMNTSSAGSSERSFSEESSSTAGRY